jgi:hypothetical protein
VPSTTPLADDGASSDSPVAPSRLQTARASRARRRSPDARSADRPGPLEAGVAGKAVDSPSGEPELRSTAGAVQRAGPTEGGEALPPSPQNPSTPRVSRRDSQVVRPPAAKATHAASRGPGWLVGLLDFIERRASAADNVDDEIRLIHAYGKTLSRVIAAVAVLLTPVAVCAVAVVLSGQAGWRGVSVLLTAVASFACGGGARAWYDKRRSRRDGTNTR